MKKTFIFRIVEERVQYVAIEADASLGKDDATLADAAEGRAEELLYEGAFEKVGATAGEFNIFLLSSDERPLEELYEPQKILECDGVRYCDAD